MNSKAKNSKTMDSHLPFHPGELLVQELANESEIAQRNGRLIRDKIPGAAIAFVAQQMMVVVSSLDKDGKVWASLLIGRPGFLTAPDASTLLLDASNIISHQRDPFWENIQSNPHIGVLAIELSTRRRLRVNGCIHQLENNTYEVKVEQAYPNCPKYIQCRQPRITDPVETFPEPIHGSTLTAEHIELISNADALFVGSASSPTPEQSCDASHRGGNPGFVDVLDSKTLRIPDYKGNSMFNTLGNIQIYPRAGLMFVDFERGYMLQLSGTAKILWNQDDPGDRTAGTQRFWELSIEQWQQTEMPSGLSWEFFDYSPHNPKQAPALGTEDAAANERIV